MNLQIENKTALITGSTKGIGFAIARLLAEEGANVIINGRSDASVNAAAEKIARRTRGLAADVSTAAGCAALVRQAPDVDILVNNAGIFEPKPFAEIPDTDWERFYQVNVMSGVRLTRGTGVTVNSVLPGPTASEGVTEFVGQLAANSRQTPAEFEREFFRSVRPTSLLQRFATADEVAAMVAYACSSLASATNGAALRVDGGVVRGTI